MVSECVCAGVCGFVYVCVVDFPPGSIKKMEIDQGRGASAVLRRSYSAKEAGGTDETRSGDDRVVLAKSPRTRLADRHDVPDGDFQLHHW